jgi:hypothetical protein
MDAIVRSRFKFWELDDTLPNLIVVSSFFENAMTNLLPILVVVCLFFGNFVKHFFILTVVGHKQLNNWWS